MSWLLNTLHEDLKSSKHNSSIIYQSFQGELEVVKEIQRKGVSEKRENGDDLNIGTAVDGGAENDSIIREASRMPFLMLDLDLPPPPSFQGCKGENYYSSGVLGIASKLAGANHVRAWKNGSPAAAASSAMVAWAVTALAMGLACKEISIGGHKGWRLMVLEAFVIILTFAQLFYLVLLHAGIFSSKHGSGYRNLDYGVGGSGIGDPAHKGGTAASD